MFSPTEIAALSTAALVAHHADIFDMLVRASEPSPTWRRYHKSLDKALVSRGHFGA